MPYTLKYLRDNLTLHEDGVPATTTSNVANPVQPIEGKKSYIEKNKKTPLKRFKMPIANAI